MTGYFRDDGPLYELMLDEPGRRELDGLWQEFDFITAAPMRQYTSFVWFERTDRRFMRDPEFDFVRAEDKDATSEAKIEQLAEVYLAKARRNGASDVGARGDRRPFHGSSRRASAGSSRRRRRRSPAMSRPSRRSPSAPTAVRLSKAERDDVAAFYRACASRTG